MRKRYINKKECFSVQSFVVTTFKKKANECCAACESTRRSNSYCSLLVMNPPKKSSKITRPCASSTRLFNNKMELTENNSLQFDEYCKARSSLQIQLMINGKTTKVFNADDPFFASIILLEQQWQYASRVPCVQVYNRGNVLGNTFYHENPSTSNVNYNFPPANKVKARKNAGQKRRIKKYEGKPKKPLTSFMLFLKDFRKSLVSSQMYQNKTSPHEINKLAGKQWHLLPENIKEQYKTEAAKALAKWQQENFLMPETASSIKKEIFFPIDPPTSSISAVEYGSLNPPAIPEAEKVKTLTESSSSSSSGDSSNSDSDDSSN